MKFLPVCRVSECPFAPHWDWQMDQGGVFDLVRGLPTPSVPWTAMTILLSLSFDTAPTLLKILLATTGAGLW